MHLIYKQGNRPASSGLPTNYQYEINAKLISCGGKGLWIKMDFLINGMIAIQQITHFQVWQIVTWQYDRNACGRKFGLPWENQPQWIWKSRTFWFEFPSSDFCTLHSKELARWPGWSFLNERAAPSVSQGVGCLHLFWAPVGAEGVGLFFCCWEPANKPPHYCANARWANLPGKNSFRTEGLPGRGASWAKRKAFYHKSIQVVLFGPLLFKEERAGNLRGAKCLWLEARLHSYKCSPVGCSEESPPAPASPSLDVSAGPGPAWWIHAFGDGID